MTALHQHVAPRQWLATLTIRLLHHSGRTVLGHAHHYGPLRIQKLLYPEGPAWAQALIIHPPGGIAAGDQLAISAAAGSGSNIQFTTPGATKWYRCTTQEATQHIQLTIAADAFLEWLPQESIFFDGTLGCQTIEVDCHPQGRTVGWEIMALGRHASGERFTQGRLRQRLDIRQGGELLYRERAGLYGDDPLLQSQIGWRGQHVAANLWALGLPADESIITACRQIQIEGVDIGVTRFANGLLLIRTLAEDVESTQRAMIALWSCLRPPLCGRSAVPPRIWAT